MAAQVNIQPELISWAITRAGHDLDDFIAKEPKVLDWITGNNQPTVRQLENFSRKLYLPFGYLFLNEPPQEPLPFPFFRTERGRVDKVNINVYDTILLLQKRQDWLKEYFIENDFAPLPFVGRFGQNRNIRTVVNSIRDTLGLNEKWASSFQTWEKALEHLVERIEDKGIITVFNGVVENNTHRKIPVSECRGFVLVDHLAPFMFINNQDGKGAQMFTIAHELAHIWIGESAGFDFRKLQPAADPIENFCDKVAAEFLVPENHFLEIWEAHPNMPYCSRYFKVSEIVIARRALDTGKISRNEFFAFYEDYRQRIKEKKDTQSPGGDFYATTKKRVSLTFASHINNALNTGQLLYRDAYSLTGLKGDTFEKFFSDHFSR